MNIIDYEKVRRFKKKDFLKTFNKYKQFLEYTGFPHKLLKTIIITGSTGKGTTARMVSDILALHGFKTGCYTSPHLVQMRERIQINRKLITRKDFLKYEKIVLSLVKKFNKDRGISYRPTFFEILTIIAFLYFQAEKVDYAVLEVGLGGRLDATNVTSPALNFILPICLEHTTFLGNNLKKILKEKQAVIKKNSITVSMTGESNLLKLLKRYCQKMNSKLFYVNKNYSTKINKIDNHHIHFLYKDEKDKLLLKVPLTSLGIIKNCGIVLFGLKQIISLNMNKVKKYLSKFTLQGRFEIISFKKKKIILDGAHNLLSIQSLVNTVKKLKWNNISIIFTLMCDKDAQGVLKILSEISENLILTRINNEREYSLEVLFSTAKKYFKEIYFTKNLYQAIGLLKNEVCIICGSFYLIGEFIKIMPKIK